MNNIKAVIFDMDGTIIDTEKYYRECWPKACQHFGYPMTDEQALMMRSFGRPFAPKFLQDMFNDPNLDYFEIRAYRQVLVKELIAKHGIQAKPGINELLDFLKEKGICTAIATATDIDRTTDYLGRVGLFDKFDKIITAGMVSQGKPAPDIYLYACEQLGLKPAECMAVEDAPNGINSAFAAGLNVVMVPDSTEPDEELMKKLFARVDSLDKIIDLF